MRNKIVACLVVMSLLIGAVLVWRAFRPKALHGMKSGDQEVYLVQTLDPDEWAYRLELVYGNNSKVHMFILIDNDSSNFDSRIEFVTGGDSLELIDVRTGAKWAVFNLSNHRFVRLDSQGAPNGTFDSPSGKVLGDPIAGERVSTPYFP